jgi:hypothetical protein
MTPNDIITLGTLVDNSRYLAFKNCTVNKSGTVKITLKPIAGFTFSVVSWGTDTITVTKD